MSKVDKMSTTRSRFAIPVEIKMNGQEEMDELKKYIDQNVMVVSIHPSGNIEAYLNKLEHVENFKYLKLKDKEPIPFIPNKIGDSIVMEVRVMGDGVLVPVYENMLVKTSFGPGYLKRNMALGKDMLRRLSFGSKIADSLEK